MCIIIISCRIFQTKGEGLDCGDEVADWISKYLGSAYRILHYSPELTFREVTDFQILKFGEYASPGDKVSFPNSNREKSNSQIFSFSYLTHHPVSLSKNEWWRLSCLRHIYTYRYMRMMRTCISVMALEWMVAASLHLTDIPLSLSMYRAFIYTAKQYTSIRPHKIGKVRVYWVDTGNCLFVLGACFSYSRSFEKRKNRKVRFSTMKIVLHDTRNRPQSITSQKRS